MNERPNVRSFLYLACSGLAVLSVLVAPGCGSDSDAGGSSGSSGSSGCTGFGCATQDGGRPGCVGLECNQVTCTGGATTLSGRVLDPAGKVPIYNAAVYVPNRETTTITTGLGTACDRCDANVSGSPIALTTTDASGNFLLENVPSGVDFPLVIQIGKWRRKITIPKVGSCSTTTASPGETRLPRNRGEGDIPRIALTTGSADPLECLLRKIGVDDSEFGTAGSDARIHLYAGGSTAPASATSTFQGGTALAAATGLWSNVNELRKYDIVMLSCEGGELESTKPTSSRQALYDYARVGGRVFTSHYHHFWFSNSPVPEVKALATWTNDFTCRGGGCTIVEEPSPTLAVNATVNTAFPKGAAMKEWLRNTQSLTGPGETLPIQEARHNVDAVTSNALSWMTIANPAAGGRTAHEYISFNTPVGAPDAEVCGRVVYSDLHVGAGDNTGVAFPGGCVTADLSPQQKALEFMLFDLSSCIQKDDAAIEQPR